MRLLIMILLMALPGMAQSVLLPDMERGVRAYQQRDFATAEANLEPLARMGYARAQHYLARLLRKRADQASLQEAMRWYSESVRAYPMDVVPLARLRWKLEQDPEGLRQAHEQLSAEADAGDPQALENLVRLYRDFSWLADGHSVGLRLQQATASGDPDLVDEVVNWYEANDGLPANRARLVELCGQYADRVVDCYPVLVAEARGAQDYGAAERLVERALARYPDPVGASSLYEIGAALQRSAIQTPPMSELAVQVLRVAARRRPRAQARLAELLLNRPDLVQAGEDPIAMLRAAMDAGSDDAQLTLGRAYLEGDRVEQDPEQARRLLEGIADRLPAAKFSLARYYSRGYGGDQGFPRAVSLLIDAARAGYSRADLELAQLYSQRLGIEANLKYAYSFALVARTNQVSGAEELLSRFSEQLEPQLQAEATALAAREFEGRRQRLPPAATEDWSEPENSDQADKPSSAALTAEQTAH